MGAAPPGLLGPGGIPPSGMPAGGIPPGMEAPAPDDDPELGGRLGKGVKDAAEGGDKNRKPPDREGSFSKLFYGKRGPPIVFEKRMSFREKMKGML